MDYIALRGTGTIRRDDDLGVWIVTGFREVSELLRSPALSSAWPERGRTRLHGEQPETQGAPRTADIVRRWFMFNDAPRHQLLRGLMAPLFSAARVAGLRPFVERTVGELLDGVPDRVDVVGGLSEPLAARVACLVIGIPQEAAPRIAAWALDIAALLVADYLPRVVERGTKALQEIEGVVAETLRSSRVPAGSALDVLERAHQEGLIEEADIAATASLLVFAGFDTTSTFIGKAVRALVHTGRWKDARTEHLTPVIDELLRFDTSVQQVARFAVAPVECAGHRIEPGDLVLLMLGVANRDDEVFPAPDTLDTERRTARHLAFGYGAHYCLGSGLARLEADAALTGLVERFGEAELAEPPVLRPHYGVTVLEHLWLRVRH
ncbi:cytochrome P450 [Streptomyces koyangensis]|uniref:cytochrome P450 n=1 Tax=Streptomyces koyangensis TaxID=188770 RepID=UPI003456F3CE